MKRIGNLYDKIISVENLTLADDKARKGKINTYGVIVHDRHRTANIRKLHDDLEKCQYKTSDYQVKKIFDPKERDVYKLPYYPDRILHHAVMNILEPIWVSIFTADTYSCIKDRGIHACAQNLKWVLEHDPEGTKYCLKIDIRKFYQSIDHDILKAIIRRKIKCKKTLALLDGIIDSVEQGVPIGNYLSQYFANLYLTYFDHWLKEVKGVKYYFRYADDIVILSDNKLQLHELLVEMRAYLRDNLKLKVKPNYQVFPVDARGIDFVGYVFKHTHTVLRKRIKKALCRRVAKLNKRKKTPSIMTYKKNIASWWGWCKYCNSVNLTNKLFKSIPYELKFDRAKRPLRHGARQAKAT